jgi:hypothetical protein
MKAVRLERNAPKWGKPATAGNEKSRKKEKKEK